MKQMTLAKAAWTPLLCALLFAGLAACNGKAQAQSGGGGNAASDLAQAADAAKDAVKSAKDAAGQAAAVTGGGKTATAGKPAEASDFVYKLNRAKSGVIITGIQKDAKFGANLVVPAEIEGFPVVAYLAQYRDSDAKERKAPPLVSVVFPDSITYMGQSRITVEDGPWSQHPLDKDYGIDEEFWKYDEALEYAHAEFSNSKSLQSIVLPKNLKIIPGDFAPICPSLKAEGITWPQEPEVIGNGAFYNNSFTSLVIPNGVKYIGGSAFKDSKTLTSITIPDSVIRIEDTGVWGSFTGCSELTTVTVSAHPITYTDDPLTFSGCVKLNLASQKAIKDTGYTGTFR
jgi:hypothetical protein